MSGVCVVDHNSMIKYTLSANTYSTYCIYPMEKRIILILKNVHFSGKSCRSAIYENSKC